MVTIGRMWHTRLLLAVCIAAGFALSSQPGGAAAPLPVSVSPDLPGDGNEKPGPGMFLVARRSLNDPLFGQSVVYLVEHDEHGSLGLIVNRRSEIGLSEALPDIEDSQAPEHTLYYGGPVGLPRIMMLVRRSSPSIGMAYVGDDVYVSADRRVLDAALAEKKSAAELRFYLGHSGWAAGQLEFELERGSWYVIEADTDAIFSADTDSLWEKLMDRLEPMGIQVELRPEIPGA